LKRRREKLGSFSVRLQPVVVVVGSLELPTAAYVVVDSTMWKVTSPLKAVDVCFKCFHVLHAAYPAESNVWLLLQKAVYHLTTKWDVKSAAVSAVATDIRYMLQ